MTIHINCKNVYASDKNKYLVALINYIFENNDFDIVKKMEAISENEYKKIRANKDDYDDWIVGAAGFLLSFRNVFFGGFNNGKKREARSYLNESCNKLKYTIFRLKNKIKWCSYDDVEYLDNSLIYCDPPYENTTEYPGAKKFDSEQFWEWCRMMSKLGYIVLISELEAPKDFKSLFSKNINNSLAASGKRLVENLFIHESYFEKIDIILNKQLKML